jgi:hypothetical protein
MEWLSENWVFLLVVVAMMAMHLFGHGGHGGHGGDRRREPDDERSGRRDDAESGTGHRH